MGVRLIGKVLAVTLVFALAHFEVYGQGAGQRVSIPAGTPVVLQLTQEVTSETAKTGDSVQVVVLNDVVISGKTVVRKGTLASGQVQKAKKAGAVGEPGELIISVQTVPAIDGTLVPISFTKSAEGQSKMGTSVVLTLLCCFLFLLKKGESTSFPINTTFSAMVIAPVEVGVP